MIEASQVGLSSPVEQTWNSGNSRPEADVCDRPAGGSLKFSFPSQPQFFNLNNLAFTAERFGRLQALQFPRLVKSNGAKMEPTLSAGECQQVKLVGRVGVGTSRCTDWVPFGLH
jgi:hypothetical protein